MDFVETLGISSSDESNNIHILMNETTTPEISAVPVEKKYREIFVSPGTPFFGIFQKVMKQVTHPKEFVSIRVADKENFKFVFDWQDENTVGISVFKELK